jgi:hypothetical protein
MNTTGGCGSCLYDAYHAHIHTNMHVHACTQQVDVAHDYMMRTHHHVAHDCMMRTHHHVAHDYMMRTKLTESQHARKQTSNKLEKHHS